MVVPIASQELGYREFAFRATLFDKTAAGNWFLAWHQDRVVPVQDRTEAAGYRTWSQKQGTWFVEPPAQVLRELLAVRVDLDGSGVDNGGLRVMPGSHAEGVLSRERIADLARTVVPVSCEVPAAGALLMRPLLLHASSRAGHPQHRRIVHLEFAGRPLPHGPQFRHQLPFATGAE